MVTFKWAHCVKQNLNASRPSQQHLAGGKISKRLDGIIGCKDKTSSWHLNGFPDGSNVGSAVVVGCLIKRKIRTHLDLLSIPQSGEKNVVVFHIQRIGCQPEKTA